MRRLAVKEVSQRWRAIPNGGAEPFVLPVLPEASRLDAQHAVGDSCGYVHGGHEEHQHLVDRIERVVTALAGVRSVQSEMDVVSCLESSRDSTEHRRSQ